MRVEFAWSENGPIIGTTPVQSSGYFEFTPGGLTDGQTYTLWARAREPSSQNAGQFVYGVPASLQFVFDTNDPSGHYVATFSLLNDTANQGGTTSDGSTQDATLTGTVAGNGSLNAISVEFDIDGDFDPDASTLTNSSGEFVFDPQVTEPGFYSILARVGFSSWNAANFVFDTDDGSPQALTLVAALSLIDADWQTAGDLDFDSIRDLAGDIFAQGVDNAESEYNFAVAVAAIAKQGIERTVDREYEQAQVDAEADYRQQVAVSQQAFLAALNGLPASQRPTYALQDFIWPSFSFGNQLIIPNDGDLPAPPTAATYDGPGFDPFRDPAYRAVVWQAEQQLLAAIRAAEQTVAQQTRISQNQHRDDIEAARQTYEATLAQASDVFDMARANNPDLDDTQFQAKVDAISAAWRTFTNAWQSAQDAFDSKLAMATNRRDQALANAADDHADAIECDPGDPPTISGWNNCTDQYHAAAQAYEAASRQIWGDFNRTMAMAEKRRSDTVANALKSAQVAVAELERQLKVIVRQHQHDTLADLLQDAHAYSVARTAASATLARDIAAADKTLARSLADLKFDKGVEIAQQKRLKDQNIAAAQLTAVQSWSQIVATPWAAYQAAVAGLEDQYGQALIGFAYDRDVALAGAVWFEANTLANAAQDQADALADADESRTVSLGEFTRDYRINTDLEYLQQHSQLAAFWANYRTTIAGAQQEHTTTSAEVFETYQTAVADANDANHQPSDVVHVRCVPQTSCTYPSGWESFLYTDNSDVRERNRVKHLRRTAAAERDRAIAQSSADQAFDHVRIEATKQYRTDTNAQVRDTTVAQASLRYMYEVDVAMVQDDYNVAVATAAATHTVSVAVATAGREYREIIAGLDFDDQAVLQKGTLDVSTAELTRAYQIAVATAHVGTVAAWGVTQSSAWAAYQADLAQAELNRVSAVQNTELSHVLRSANINVASIRQNSVAELTFAESVFGSSGAYVTRANTMAQAYLDLAEDNSLQIYVGAKHWPSKSTTWESQMPR